MFEKVWFVAAAWMALALVASLISIWTGVSVALIEILVGVVAGNFCTSKQTLFGRSRACITCANARRPLPHC